MLLRLQHMCCNWDGIQQLGSMCENVLHCKAGLAMIETGYQGHGQFGPAVLYGHRGGA